MVVYAVDVGGATLKHGAVSAATYSVSPNYVRMNAKQHAVQIRRPIERGYVVNWTLQGDLWQDHLSVNQDTTLVVTSPLFTPEKLRNMQDEVVFEEFQMAAYTSVPPQAMVPHASSSNHGVSFPYCVVVDVGFSATQIVPLVHGHVVLAGVRRLNVGGKLLTNYLKECVSLRQWNMMDAFEVVNEVKEAVCRCSLDFHTDMQHYANHETASVQWALPDFVHAHRGALDPISPPAPDAQILRLGVETIAIPEVLFHPSDIGLDQAGLAAGIVDAISACDVHLHGLLFQHIVVTGGTSKLPAFVDRLRADLRPLVPDEYAVLITLVDDPIGAAWRGCQRYASTPDCAARVVTKAEYLEHGSTLCRDRFLG
ncbi:Aste57867_16951 [Aphanomyces stellatus]|uniref:Aste57867_16951 protein n=1 Tax=Aphanomyces stellatus TaxID=120398 RepID=A0A485L6Z6_9STRA|nr:hypothetical protein As57867_016893 [Aphanomyces stellatus]VFT93713.1 Aste57867_16951 [Aphanomyces stellatus]